MIYLVTKLGAKYPIENTFFPDGTRNFKLNKSPDFIAGIRWEYENDGELFAVICLRRHFSRLNLWLDLPYCPNARMDRVKLSTDVFTLKYFAEIINSLNFSAVYIEDPHSSVAPALINNCEIISAWSNILSALTYLDEEPLLVYPDEGAMKRYDYLKKPYTYAIKHRNWETGKIESLEIVDKNGIKGKDCLIIDDICSYGGTFYYTAKALKELGANKIYLYATHIEDNIDKGKLFEDPSLIEKVFTPSVIYHGDNPKIIKLNEDNEND